MSRFISSRLIRIIIVLVVAINFTIMFSGYYPVVYKSKVHFFVIDGLPVEVPPARADYSMTKCWHWAGLVLVTTYVNLDENCGFMERE